MNRIIGFDGLYPTGLTCSSTPPCGGTLVELVGVADAEAVSVLVRWLRVLKTPWWYPALTETERKEKSMKRLQAAHGEFKLKRVQELPTTSRILPRDAVEPW